MYIYIYIYIYIHIYIYIYIYICHKCLKYYVAKMEGDISTKTIVQFLLSQQMMT